MCRKSWLLFVPLVIFSCLTLGPRPTLATDTVTLPDRKQLAEYDPYTDAADCDFATMVQVVGVIDGSDGNEYLALSRGSGFVFLVDGVPHILVGSAGHVHEDFKKILGITVTFRVHGKEFDKSAHVVAYDDSMHRDALILELNDAQFRFDGKVAELGNSLSIVPGDSVTAIGSPRNRRFVKSAGKVLSTAYRIKDIPYFFIAHDAKIEPGSSGGPLCNEYGEVVGVNVRYNPETGESLAMPIDRVKEVINQFRRSRAKEKAGAGK